MIIPNEDLTIAALPPPDAGWNDLADFCLTFDGYANGQRDIAALSAIADRVMAGELAGASMDEMRCALFYWQRKVRWTDLDPIPDTIIAAARAVVAELRHRLGG